MHYHLSFHNPLTHIINVTIKLPVNNQKERIVKLPKWRPGRYQGANFAANLYKIHASAGSSPLTVTSIGTHAWSIACEPGTEVVVNYAYYAHVLDGGGTYLDANQLYINPINCLLYMEESLDSPCQLTIDYKAFSQIATSLKGEYGNYFADDYHVLVDSPIICSKMMEQHTFTLSKQTFHIWVQGKHAFDMKKLVSDITRYTTAQMSVLPMGGDIPFHYLIQIVPYKYYHGVEHAHSTTIVIGSEDMTDPSLYENLMGVCSHELFHYWNVKRMRPKELLPYRYDTEVLFNTGYVVEGFTTYYGDLFLIRSEVFDEDWFLGEINQKLLKHFQNGGRNHLSLLESSMNLWVDGYQPGIPDRKVSIYNEGALVALLLDLYLRKETDHRVSLDVLVKEMWKKYGNTGIGYTHEDVIAISSALVGIDMSWFFEQYIGGYQPIDSLLGELANWVGLSCEKIYPARTWEKYLGVKFKQTPKGILVAFIEKESVASAHFSLEDQLLSVDDVAAHHYLPELPEKNQATVKIKRFGEEKTLTIAWGESLHLGYFQLGKNPHATVAQRTNKKAWLSPQVVG